MQVGALRDLRKDMGVRRNVLLKALVEEIQLRLFFGAVGDESDGEDEAEDDTPELQVCRAVRC